jgi:hypothetical protein
MGWTVWDVMWSMFVFFFWFMYVWMFITLFVDILHRHDIHGWAKAGWLILIIFLPLIGALLYLARRPKMTAEDKAAMEAYQQSQRRAVGYSAAEEIAKATDLKDKGIISEAEFQELKRKALL